MLELLSENPLFTLISLRSDAIKSAKVATENAKRVIREHSAPLTEEAECLVKPGDVIRRPNSPIAYGVYHISVDPDGQVRVWVRTSRANDQLCLRLEEIGKCYVDRSQYYDTTLRKFEALSPAPTTV